MVVSLWHTSPLCSERISPSHIFSLGTGPNGGYGAKPSLLRNDPPGRAAVAAGLPGPVGGPASQRASRRAPQVSLHLRTASIFSEKHGSRGIQVRQRKQFIAFKSESALRLLCRAPQHTTGSWRRRLSEKRHSSLYLSLSLSLSLCLSRSLSRARARSQAALRRSTDFVEHLSAAVIVRPQFIA